MSEHNYKRSLVWPHNFLSHLFAVPAEELSFAVPADFDETVEYLLSDEDSISRITAEMFWLRYRERMTLDAVASRYGLTRERVRQRLAKVIRRWRHPSFRRYFTEGMAAAKAKEAEERKQFEATVPFEQRTYIDSIGLSARPFNALYRFGIRTVEDMKGLSLVSLMKIQNMGKKSAVEVMVTMSQLGYPLDIYGSKTKLNTPEKAVRDMYLAALKAG